MGLFLIKFIVQKMKFSIKDFLVTLLKKSLMENLIFYEVIGT